MEEKLVTPIDSTINFFEFLNKEKFKSDNLYLDFSKLWKNPPSDKLKEKIRRWLISGKRVETLFTLISFYFMEEIKNEEKKRNKNDN